MIDATYTPVNHDHLTLQQRNKRFLHDLPVLVEELREYVGIGTGVVLVKANVCICLSFLLYVEPILTAHGFPSSIAEGQFRPSTGQQNRFREAVREVLGRQRVINPAR